MTNQHELPIFPLSTVLFPGMVLPLHIFEPRYKDMMHYCITHNEPFGVVLIDEGIEVGAGNATIFDIGTTAHITQVDQFDDGRMNIATLGMQRFVIRDIQPDKYSYLSAIVEDFPFVEDSRDRIEEEAEQVSKHLMKYLKLLATISDTELQLDTIPSDATTIAFLTAIVLRTPMEDKQDLLATPSLLELLTKEGSILRRESQMISLMAQRNPTGNDGPTTPFSMN